jgi:hypothetical protein
VVLAFIVNQLGDTTMLLVFTIIAIAMLITGIQEGKRQQKDKMKKYFASRGISI